MRIHSNMVQKGAVRCVALLIGGMVIAAAPLLSSAAEAKDHFARAVRHIQRGELDKAVVELKKTIAIDPDFADAHYNLGFIYHVEAAKKNNTKPEISFNEVAGQIYLKKWEHGREELDLAIKEMKEVLRLQPNAPDAHFKLGLLYDNKGEYEKAFSEYRTAIALDPRGLDGQDARTNIALIYYFVEKRRGDAIKEIQSVLNINPNHPIAKNALKVFQK